MSDRAYQELLLRQEWRFHSGRHKCYYEEGPDAGTALCPTDEYETEADFLEDRLLPEFPVEFEKDRISGQDSGGLDSGQDSDEPAGSPFDGMTVDEILDSPLRCFTEDRFKSTPESPTIAPGGFINTPLDPSATDISLLVERLDAVLGYLENIEENLARIEHDAKADAQTLLQYVMMTTMVAANPGAYIDTFALTQRAKATLEAGRNEA